MSDFLRARAQRDDDFSLCARALRSKSGDLHVFEDVLVDRTPLGQETLNRQTSRANGVANTPPNASNSTAKY
jgi:hypothetical protein